jgi:hypothetical protein
MKIESIEKSIILLTEKISKDIKADDALKYTQSALNLAHVLQTIDCIKTK